MWNTRVTKTRFSSQRVNSEESSYETIKKKAKCKLCVKKQCRCSSERVCILISEPRSLTQDDLVYMNFVVKPHKLPGATWI